MSVASPSPLRGRWDRVPYVSKCAHFSVQIYYRRTSRFEQSCEPTDFCKAETIGSHRTTEPTRRRQKTKCEGYNKRQLTNRKTGPNKNIVSVAERERQVLDSVPINYIGRSRETHSGVPRYFS